MPRNARLVIPGIPYHLTHRGNKRGEVFFGETDRQLYLADLAVWAHDFSLAIWGYCLMSNHVHIVAVPAREDSLEKAIGRVHQRHARRINAARGWTGHLWANRFFSTPLDEAHLWTAIRYVELNPVRAGLTTRAEDWPWSSARAHCGLESGAPLLAADRPFGGMHPDPMTGEPIPWSDWLARGIGDEDAASRLRTATLTGRPCGDETFVKDLEQRLGRSLTPQKRGRKPKEVETDENQLDLF